MDGQGTSAAAAGSAPAAESYVDLVAVDKSFGGVRALSGVNLSITRGSVHALVGENGAGKSTLSRVIAGLIMPDAGEVRINGTPAILHSPRDALARGIASIAQELELVPSLTVAENVFLGSEPRRGGFIRRRALRARFNALVAEAGFDLKADAVVSTLRTADRQKVEILRALSRRASLIIMDEPTAALSGPDVQRLHEVVHILARRGRTVLFVSHFLKEVLTLADTVTILRDGHLVRTGPAAAETESSLIEGMLGRTLGSVFPAKPDAPSGSPPVLEVSGLRAPGVNGVDLTVHAGEIVGLAGLVGAGRSEIAHAILGAARATAGTVAVRGERLYGRSPTVALRRGVALVPESRKEQGLFPDRSVTQNATLASLKAFSVGTWIRRAVERRAAADVLTAVTVRATRNSVPVSALSGGNQQKVLFARALLCRPCVLIADEPTRGVDVGSRRAIYDLLVEQAGRGVAVLVISSDIEEVLGLAHRVVVIRSGRVAAELNGSDMTNQAVLTAAFAEQAGPEHPEAEKTPL